MIIEVENLSKLYKLGSIGSTTLRESLNRAWYRMIGKEELGRRIGEKDLMIPPDHPQAGPEPNTFWALKDVSFTVEQGEIVGVIGRNGAGKSTLLKVLTRITEPTSGRAVLRGRVGSLLEVGTGFHPELTGRENIFLNGAILGMRRREIERKFDEIVAFAEVERFIDTPVKRYSSGMYVRLAFAVAAHLDPEILLVDEVLAVGDAAFQTKCLGKMKDVAGEGRTVLFVSHNMAAISQLCGRGILLDGGRISVHGATADAIKAYLVSRDSNAVTPVGLRHDREGDGRARITGLAVNSDSTGTSAVCTGDRLRFDLDYTLADRGGTPGFHLGLYDMFGIQLIHMSSRTAGAAFVDLGLSGRVTCVIPKFPLPPGQYRLNAAIMWDGRLADRVESAAILDVESGDYYGSGDTSAIDYGKCLVEHEWLRVADVRQMSVAGGEPG